MIKSKMKNKKGDLPITILVILVFVLLTVTLVSFVLSNTRSANSFANLGIFENLTSQSNSFYFYLHSGMDAATAAKLVGGSWNSSTNQLTLQQDDKGKLSVVYIINVKK